MPAGDFTSQSTGVRLPGLSPRTAILLGVASASVDAQSVRDHTRLTPNRSTAVTEAQATELTLTLTEASVRPIQIWVRTAGADRRCAEGVDGRAPGGPGRASSGRPAGACVFAGVALADVSGDVSQIVPARNERRASRPR